MNQPISPIRILIAALGGEGGGVLTKWIAAVAEQYGAAVSYTYVPGVAQRTGATTYYLELFPRSDAVRNALSPCPGDVDILLASEAMEAGRALQGGFITRDRTAVIASSHRAYTVMEKAHPGDGRLSGEAILDAVRQHSRSMLGFDMASTARRNGSVINAVMLGALAGSGLLPIPRDMFETAIRDGGIAIKSNLKGFAAGFEAAKAPPSMGRKTRDLEAQVFNLDSLPEPARRMVGLGMAKLTAYQNAEYARLYLSRLTPLVDLDRQRADCQCRLTNEAARGLARLMAYDDVVRVAELKTRHQRFARISKTAGGDGRLLRITDYLKPGLDEVVALLPSWLAGPFERLTRRLGIGKAGFKLRVEVTSIGGFALMRILAALRPLRPWSTQWAKQQALAKEWLDRIINAAATDYDRAVEIAACAGLIKGYADTHCRGQAKFDQVMTDLDGLDADAIRRLRRQAAATPESIRPGLAQPGPG